MKNHYCVIMSGGIGSRFWPASRSSYPKQFLDFFGTGRSLIQQTFDRIKKIVPVENIFVVTNQRYNDLTLEQLPELKPEQILLEPCRRNTAPCIAYAAHHIHAINPNASMVVAPSDHLILKEDEFLNSLSNGLDFVSKHDALLTLGIKPNRPETGYGYIQACHQSLDGFTKVKAFTEKPNLELAKVFLESGDFYWNSGIFLWNVQSIIKAFNEFLPEVAQAFNNGLSLFNTEKEKAFIDEMFPSCPNISIDYGVMEKANNVYVQMGDFGWSDLGTWGSLHELSPNDENGNSILKCDA
ncbi:MAG: mannose-1-phosphate guanylyltransferase, partial [Bacteroidales bacterium]|nr:mannose-1-phosphate guanylyltransferase [Bacteroidales bacterium]